MIFFTVWRGRDSRNFDMEETLFLSGVLRLVVGREERGGARLVGGGSAVMVRLRDQGSTFMFGLLRRTEPVCGVAVVT